MAKNSPIEWTDHTFNPWWGCAKVSPACDHCYAERDAKRHAPGQILWGARSVGGCQPLNWVIVGGESGPGARAMHPHWAELIRRDCAVTSTPFFFKQWGEWAPMDGVQHATDVNGAWVDSKQVPVQLLGGQAVFRLGKKRAGRTLYGKTWSQFPESA